MNLSNQENSLDKERIIDRYTEKWDKIIFSTEPVDRVKAEAVIIKAYALLNLPPPTIYFLTSPSAGQCSIFDSIEFKDNTGLFLCLKGDLQKKFTVNGEIVEEFAIDRLSYSSKFDELENRGVMFERLCDILYSPYLAYQYWDHNILFYKLLPRELFWTYPWYYDFYFDFTNDEINREVWAVLKSLCEECPYLITNDRLCIIIERPSELNLDRWLLPHGESQPAVRYNDGYEIYCHHGTAIPATYGKDHPSSESILLEEQEPKNTDLEQQNQDNLVLMLLSSIGYKRFSKELPQQKNRYWQKDETIRNPSLMDWSFNIIDDWFDLYSWRFHRDRDNLDKLVWVLLEPKTEDSQLIIKNLPCILSEELGYLYQKYIGYLAYSIIPRLSFYPLSKAIENPKPGLNDYLVRLFQGDRGEIYYVICDRTRRIISPIYCRFPNAKPMIYAECVTSFFAAIAECYRSGAYYITVNEITGARSIEQDLDKVEPIFEKFNPYQIDNWRKIWKDRD
jgi:hypothetical protein